MSIRGKPKATLGVTQSHVGGSKMQSRYGGQRSTFGTTRSQALSLQSKRGVAISEPHWKPPVKVLDDAGQDVTPHPLFHHQSDQPTRKGGNLLAESTVTGTMTTDILSNSSILAGSISASQFGGGPFTRSVLSHSQDTESEASASVGPSAAATDMAQSIPDLQTSETAEDLTEEDLSQKISLRLQETDTIWLLDLHATAINKSSKEAEKVNADNEKYQQLVKNKVGSDLYQDRGMNTFNYLPKFKQVQTDKVEHSEIGSTATCWDMYDSFEAQRLAEIAEAEAEAAEDDILPEKVQDKEAREEKRSSLTASKSVTKSQHATSKSSLSSTQYTESIFATKSTTAIDVAEDLAETTDAVLNNDKLREDLFYMERAINLNTYQNKLALYRHLPVIHELYRKHKLTKEELAAMEMLKEAGPIIELLFWFTCPITQGRNISCMTWNKENPDLLAIGYGEYDYNEQKPGIICCWSLKNVEYPERVFHCENGVTAIDFSRINPNVLAVGFYDGSIAIYNVRHSKDEAILDSFSSPGKHTGPVWQLNWIERERSSGENMAEILVSVSSDGRVVQWSLRKGFESHDLMRLKRSPHRVLHVQPGGKPPGAKERKSEALICRYSGGFCFDFHPQDPNTYLAGTEEGLIYRCTCSYTEQYMDSFSGHTGPVYRIQWSPFLKDAFISCAADWTVRLWDENHNLPVLSFKTVTEYVFDVAWSPRSSTVFAVVTERCIHVWDLSINTLDPIIKYRQGENQAGDFRTVAFAKHSDVILVSDSIGQMFVIKYSNVQESHDDQAGALRKVMDAVLASQLNDSKVTPALTEE